MACGPSGAGRWHHGGRFESVPSSEACFKGLKAFEDWTFENPVLQAMYRTELPNVVMRIMGSKIGRGVYMSRNVQDAPMIYWDLLSIGDNSVLDGSNIAGSSRIFHVHRPLTIGSDCATRQPAACHCA